MKQSKHHRDPNLVHYSAPKKPSRWPLLWCFLFIVLVIGLGYFFPPWPQEKPSSPPALSQADQTIMDAAKSVNGVPEGQEAGELVISNAYAATQATTPPLVIAPDAKIVAVSPVRPKAHRKRHHALQNIGYPASAFPPDPHRNEFSQYYDDRSVEDHAR